MTIEDRVHLLDSRSVSRKLWSRYILGAVSVVLLLSVHHGAGMFSLRAGAQDEELINISGRQRMLSQRIILLSEQLADTGDARLRERLEAAVATFDAAHRRLTEVAREVPHLREIYAFGDPLGLDSRARSFVSQAGRIGAEGLDAEAMKSRVARLSALGRDALLARLDAAANGFEAVATDRKDRLRMLQHVSFAAALAILALEFWIIFRPTLRWVTHTVGRLDRDANIDTLTGLMNRRCFSGRLKELEAATGQGSALVVIALDLDGFKSVNDVLGHPAGDEVLRHVAGRLLEEADRLPARGEPLVSRFGGDEFFVAFAVDEAHSDWAAKAFGDALIDRMTAPIPIRLEGIDESCLVGVSLGYAVQGPEAVTRDAVLSNADIALYAAKRAGKGRIARFRPDFRAAAVARLKRETDLRRGIMDSEFDVFFQPRMNFATGAFAGFEALTRWRHPEKGLLTPQDFAEDAIDLGLMSVIEGTLIFRTLDGVARMRDRGHAVPHISVDVCERTLDDAEFVENLVNACAMYDLPVATVTIEVLETHAVADRADRAVQNLRRLADAGFRTAIDGFGSRYSSLVTIAALDLDDVKLDGALVIRHEEARVEKVLSAAISMAKAMNLRVVAEGIEAWQTFEALRAMGADIAQGTFVGPPMDADAAIDWLAARSATTPTPLPGSRRA